MGFVQWLAPVLAYIVPHHKTRHFFKVRSQCTPITLPNKTSKRYWFHCASLGEFEQIVPVIEALKAQDDQHSIVITFFSASGYQYRHQYPLADTVLYLPIDTLSNMNQMVKALDADVLVLVKYELWYNLLKACHSNGTDVVMVSAVFRPQQFLFSAFGSFILKQLQQVKHILVQDQSSLDCLIQQGIQQVSIGGDTRYDRVLMSQKKAEPNTSIAQFVQEKPCLILGSSWPKEESILLSVMSELQAKGWVCIVAPHDVSADHINNLQKQLQPFLVQLYTDFNSSVKSSVLILNTIGQLANAYQYADLAFVGGGYSNQLHNILEPLTFGVPVVFGPHCAKYREAQMAIETQVAHSIPDAAAFESLLQSNTFNKRQAALSQACLQFIQQHSGATDLVLQQL
jgi:3-deoxy-D-manno-octulosonic-acid transferase